MKKKKQIHFTVVKCDRCGKQITTATRSILGNDSLKKKWGLICEDCTTPEEKYQILKDQEEDYISEKLRSAQLDRNGFSMKLLSTKQKTITERIAKWLRR